MKERSQVKLDERSDFLESFVEVEGLTLCTRLRPALTRVDDGRPPLLLVNGLGGSLTSWGPLLAALPERDIVMVDTPGSGRSQTPRLPIPVRDFADLIVGATRSFGVHRVDVLGFSLGGTVAQEIAKRHPDLIRRLVLVATIHGFGARPVPLKALRTLLSTQRYRDKDAAQRDLPRLAGGLTARDAGVLEELLTTRESYPPSRRGYHYQQLSLLGWSSWPWLKRLTMPSLVMHGESDPVVPLVNAHLLAYRLPNARLEVIREAGHLMLFDQPVDTGARIEKFLRAEI